MDETKNPVDNDQKGDDKRSKGGGSKVVPKTKTERTDSTSLNGIKIDKSWNSTFNIPWNVYY